MLHEKHHLENHDPIKILLGRLVVSALFCIPALRDVLMNENRLLTNEQGSIIIVLRIRIEYNC